MGLKFSGTVPFIDRFAIVNFSRNPFKDLHRKRAATDSGKKMYFWLFALVHSTQAKLSTPPHLAVLTTTQNM